MLFGYGNGGDVLPRIRTHVYAFVSEKTIDSFDEITTHTFRIRGREATIHWYSWDVPFSSTEVLWFDAPPVNRKQPKEIRGAFCNQRFVLTGLGGTVRFRIGQSSDLGISEVDVKAPFEIIEYSLHAWEHPKIDFKTLDPPSGSIPSTIPEISKAAWNVILRESIRLIGVDGIAIAPNTEDPDFGEWDYQIVRSSLSSDSQLREIAPTGRPHALELEHVKEAAKHYDVSNFGKHINVITHYETISDKTGFGVQSVRKQIHEAFELGLIQRPPNALALEHVKEAAKHYDISTYRKHGLARQEFERISDLTGFGVQSVRKQITEGIKLGLIQVPPKEEGKSK